MLALLPVHFIIYGFDLGSTSFYSFIASIQALHVLSRRDFGKVQNKVFPYQFGTQIISPLLVGLTAPYTLTPTAIGLLAASSVGGLANVLWASPHCKTIKERRYAIIDTVYGGDDKKAEDSEELKALDKRFMHYHSWSLFFNMVSIVSITAYSWVLSNGVLTLKK